MKLEWQEINNTYRQIRTSLKLNLLDHEGKEYLLNNLQYRDFHKGERCFILGNGPSLNLFDLSCLKNEFVFAVNEFVRFPHIRTVKPDYYVIADSKFFELRPDVEQDKAFIQKISNLKHINQNVRIFVPLSNRGIIKKYNWDKDLIVQYFNSYLNFYSGYDKSIDLTKMIPEMQNVVQYAIIIAIYMGFTEIYLLGTDQTNIFGNLKAYMSQEISEYAFEMKGDEKKWKHQKLIGHSLTDTLRGYARIFELFVTIQNPLINQSFEYKNLA